MRMNCDTHALFNIFQRVARSQEELRDKVFQPERTRLEVVIRKDVEYIDRKSDSDQWINSSVD